MNYTIDIVDSEFLVVKPVEEMTDAEYDKIKPVIEKAGGHWREKYKGFVFKTDTSHKEAYTEDKEKNQFFPTPYSVVKRMIILSGMKNMSKCLSPKVLEPSAGRGAILDAIKKQCNAKIYAVEPNEENLYTLQKKGYYMAEQRTFEEWAKQNENQKNSFNYVLMNPPFSQSRDVLHTMLAYEFLKDGGTLVAVVSENSLYYENEHSKKFRDWLYEVDAHIEDVPYGSFKESGTTIDTVLIKITKG